MPYPNPDAFTKIPPQPKEWKPGHLTREKLEQFFKEGYLIIEDFFKPEELEPCKGAIAENVDILAKKMYAAGKIKKLYTEYGLFQRLAMMEKDSPGASIVLFKTQKFPTAFGDLWSNPRLLNMMEQLIGPDIAGHPVWNLRTKTPKNEIMSVPWHQDSAYFSEDSYDHLIPTAWIPFLDTDEFNGGMQVVKNAHTSGKVARHTCGIGETWYVDLSEEEMEKTLDADIANDVVTCRVPYGGMLLFHNLTPHRSLYNQSNDIRWSIDLRWQSPNENWGFYDITEGILFRTAEEETIKPDWEKFLKVNRKEVWQKRHYNKVIETDSFDTTITGPWFGRWEIVNNNRHTEAFKRY